jgi:mannose-6-phosphate isomerase-like protein (cupin superfamily)
MSRRRDHPDGRPALTPVERGAAVRRVRGMLADRGGGHMARELVFFALADEDQPPFGLSRFRVAPGGAVADDCHAERELWCILGGTGELTIDGKVAEVTAGDNLFLVPGTTHSLRNPTDTDIEVISVWWPPIAASDPRRAP